MEEEKKGRKEGRKEGRKKGRKIERRVLVRKERVNQEIEVREGD